MSALTIRMLEEICKNIPDDEKDNPVILLSPKVAPIPGVWAFEEACPGVSSFIELGPPVKSIMDSHEGPQFTKGLLIAPHRMHDEMEQDGEEGKEMPAELN